MLIDDGIMIAGMDSRTLNIRAYISPDESSNLRSGKLSGPLIWPAYLFVELINIKVDNENIKKGQVLSYRGCTYFVNIDDKIESDLNKYGKATLNFSPLGNTIDIHNVTKMNQDNKRYRHFLNKCMDDLKIKGKKPNYDGLDKRTSLNTFLDEYRHLLPEYERGELFNRITGLEDKLRNGPARI